MFNKNLLISFTIFSLLMILTSIIKTETRKIEKNIFSVERNVASMQNTLYEAQLDYYYLSSPESIYKKIQSFSNEEYESIQFSKIYFSIEHFLNEQKKISKSTLDEKKIQK
tara:strand:+ start:240 stop:572 length:333 start_codon:yes stop_codon:yes gene_type:complete